MKVPENVTLFHMLRIEGKPGYRYWVGTGVEITIAQGVIPESGHVIVYTPAGVRETSIHIRSGRTMDEWRQLVIEGPEVDRAVWK